MSRLPDTRTLALPLAGGAALAALVVAVDAGLERLGVGVGSEVVASRPHGALMVGGFVGTLIALERARASTRALPMLVPLASAAGALALLLGQDGAGQALSAAAALGLAVLMAWFWSKQPQLPLLLVGAGALAWAGASLAWWRTAEAVRAVPWWAAFLALTILGERLEITRFARRSTLPAQLAAALMVTALVCSLWDFILGVRVLGAAFLLAGLWLLRADTARVTVLRGGLATYAGLSLLVCYAWLALAGGLLLARGLGGAWYDATLHTYFVGFVLGAIFAHGPIIFPALTGRGVRLTPLLFAALAVLHASVALRLAAGLEGDPTLRQTAALMHVAALVLFALGMALGALLERRTTPALPSRARARR
jgi:hypothetical protein